MLRKNVSGQFIHFQGVDATTGGIKSGVTWTARRCIDGTFAAAGLTVTEDSTNGWYKAALTQADTNGNNIAFNFTGSGAVPQTINVITTAADPTDAVHFGLSALPNTACTTNASLLTSGTGTDQLSVATGRIDVGKLLGTAWLTPGTAGTPDVNVKLWNALTTVALPLVPTVAGRTLDCSAGGEAGVDWANVGSPTTSNALTGTTIATTQKVDIETIKTNPVVNAGTVTFPTTATLASTTNITAGTITTVTNLTNAPTAGDLTATMKTSVTTACTASTPTIASVSGAVGSVTGNVGGNVVGSVASVTAGCTLTSAYDFAKGTVAVTESYNADGSAPTPVQALMGIMQLLMESSIATTAWTVKKLDGSTTAFGLTINNATTPTSVTRTS